MFSNWRRTNAKLARKSVTRLALARRKAFALARGNARLHKALIGFLTVTGTDAATLSNIADSKWLEEFEQEEITAARKNASEPAMQKTKVDCSFCGKNQVEVKKIIAGPRVYICNECIGVCNEVLREEPAEA